MNLSVNFNPNSTVLIDNMAPRKRYQSIKSIKATKQEERRNILKLCKHKFKAIEDFDYLPSTRSVLIKNHLKVLIKEDLLHGVDENKTVQGKEINLNSRTLTHDDLRFKINIAIKIMNYYQYIHIVLQ